MTAQQTSTQQLTLPIRGMTCMGCAAGHHRSGILRFKVPDYTTDFVEVVIHDVAGVPERVFHWNLTQ
jgi:hypothetical protein